MAQPFPILWSTPCDYERESPTTLQAILCIQLASLSSPVGLWVCGNETIREVALSPSLDIFKSRLENSLNNLIRPHCWTCFEEEIVMKTFPGPFHCHFCDPLITLTPGEKGRQPSCCPTACLEANDFRHHWMQEPKVRYYSQVANRISKVQLVY